jgi:signal transduction histidine kinase
MTGPLRDVARALGLAALYVVVGKLGLMMDAVSGFATLVWPPTGLALAALLLYGPRLWPGVAIGAFVVNVWTGAPPLVALGISAGNTLEAVVGAYALWRVKGFTPKLETLRDTLALILLAALGSTLVSATLGVGCLWLGGVVPGARVAETWRAWWIGDIIGDLVVAPLLLTWLARPSRFTRAPHHSRHLLETVLIAAPLVGTAAFVLSGSAADGGGPFAQPYLIFPLLIGAALRFGPRGAAAVTFLVSASAIAGAALGHGPFVRETLVRSLAFLQTFMAAAAATTLILSAVSEERRRALSLRDSLISIASHELKTPLTSLQLQVEMLGRTLGREDGLDRSRLAAGAAAAERYVRRLDRLVDELLDVSRLTARRLRLDAEEVDLAEVVREVLGRLQEDDKRGWSFAPPGDPVIGRWDRMRIDQIVTNLLSNAAKYGGGKPVQIAVERRSRRARFTVADHGQGISPDDRARIFEPFERGRSGDGIGGFGLGLWIVRELIDALGGTITLESEVGTGTTFMVELPLEEPVSHRTGSR